VEQTVGHRALVEHRRAAARQGAGDVVAGADLRDDGAQPAARRGQADGGGDRRLADAALAGDDDEVAVRELVDQLGSPSQ
jgi:hypothetical protein